MLAFKRRLNTEGSIKYRFVRIKESSLEPERPIE